MRCLACSMFTPYIKDRKKRECISCNSPVWLDTHENFIDETTRIPPGIRESQVGMAEFIDERMLETALSKGKKTCRMAIQAEVGIGKTLAYLLPALNVPGNILVSTATTNLQRQITGELKSISDRYKELFGGGFQYVVLKGAGNYACQLAMDNARDHDLITDKQYKELSRGFDSSVSGEVAHATPPIPEKLRRFATPRPRCTKKMCTHHTHCSYYKTLQDVAAPHSKYRVVVVNHALLSQMIMSFTRTVAGSPTGGGLWGTMFNSFSNVIIDEGHEFVEYLQRAFEINLYLPKYRSTLNTLQRSLNDADKAYVKDALTAASAFRVAAIAQYEREGGFKEMDLDLSIAFENFRKAHESVEASIIRASVPDSVRTEMRFTIHEFTTAVHAFERDYMKFTEDKDSKTKVIIKRPISRTIVQATLGVKNVVFTSGTLAVNNAFEHLGNPLGLTFEEKNQHFAASPFDYERQAVFYMPDNPGLDPRNARGGDLAFEQYLTEVANEVETLVELTNGYAFVLFCAKREMFGVLKKLRQRMRERGSAVHVQDGYMKTEEILNNYKGDAASSWTKQKPGPVLFGLNSFWHGVSVEKEALQLVIVTKLWFPHPKDPQMEFMQEQLGRSAFQNYSVPESIKKVVQAEGRLIRTKYDYGIFALMDYRLRNTRYGSRIRNSLKTAQNTVGTLSYLKKEWATIKDFMGATT